MNVLTSVYVASSGGAWRASLGAHPAIILFERTFSDCAAAGISPSKTSHHDDDAVNPPTHFAQQLHSSVVVVASPSGSGIPPAAVVDAAAPGRRRLPVRPRAQRGIRARERRRHPPGGQLLPGRRVRPRLPGAGLGARSRYVQSCCIFFQFVKMICVIEVMAGSSTNRKVDNTDRLHGSPVEMNSYKINCYSTVLSHRYGIAVQPGWLAGWLEGRREEG